MKLFLFLLGILLSNQTLEAQKQRALDFLKADISIHIDSSSRSIGGNVHYTFKALSKVDSVFLDAQNMSFSEVSLNNRSVKYTYDGKKLGLSKKMKAGKTYSLSIHFNAVPRQTVYFIGWDDNIPDNNQIWTQGQGKYSSHWLPSFDDMNEKVIFNMDLTFDKNYEIIANGKLERTEEKEGLKTWSFRMNKPMSSYLLAFAIGNYNRKELISSSGIPLELYYLPKDSLCAEPTYRYTRRIFDFLEEEIGFSYPWQNYKQVPVRDFLYAGMENTGTTIFSEAFVIDSTAFKDKNYVNVNAHELAHQWFGNLVTEGSGEHHWLHEGFATFYAYLAEKDIFGEEYFYWRLYDTAKQLEDLEQESRGDALTNPKAGSLTFYEKGAWALYILYQDLGEKNFKKGIRSYLEKYQYQNVTIDEFIAEMEDAGGKDLLAFREEWLEDDDFPFDEVKKRLIKASRPIKDFFDLQKEMTSSSDQDEAILDRYWTATDSEELKKRIILKYHKSLSNEFLKKAFDSQKLKIRQALSAVISPVPSELRTAYEGLLKEDSYITVENAFYQLWIQFPESRPKYLDMTAEVEGFPNKNIRLLWLLLAVLTRDYLSEEDKQLYTLELVGYTSPQYSFEIRQNAFQLLNEVQGLTDSNLVDLINASAHHSWQFRKFARRLLDKLLEDDKQKERLLRLSQGLNDRETRYLKSKISKK
ncbi:M1 family metallopeptidase [Poritiphilus flavus]|uniref:Aminopeptidase N n=1 Tax=Poritiphilus flavus TaxID=2697053 RepID=A0A6L9EEV1_9FLAO|nr:M1 family metallopeptidase [Poritiphilus flavus]NAS13102.1 M1 family peptidase [Poritiphilus flavus]